MAAYSYSIIRAASFICFSRRAISRSFSALEKQMKEAARMMEYEYAALLRDQIIELRGK